MQRTERHSHPGPRAGDGQRSPGFRELRIDTAATHSADDPSQTVLAQPPHKVRAGAAPSNIRRKLITWMPATIAAPLAFFVALWLTKPGSMPPEAAILAKATVLDATSLMAAVQTAGLHGATDIKGAIEEIRRVDSERVTIRGWAADAASALPLTVVVFAGRTHALVAANEVNVIAHLVGLSDGASTRTSFHDTFACTRGETIHIVAVAADRRYSQFRSLACP